MPTYTLETPAGEGEQGTEDAPKRKYPIIEEDTWVDATVTAVNEVEKVYTDDDGVNVRKVEFEFGFEWEGQERKTWGETSTNFVFHPNCKLRNWAQEILVADLPEQFQLNTDHLVGQPCRIQLGVRSWNTPKSKGEKNFAKDVMRPRGSAISAPGEEAAAASTEYVDPF